MAISYIYGIYFSLVILIGLFPKSSNGFSIDFNIEIMLL